MEVRCLLLHPCLFNYFGAWPWIWGPLFVALDDAPWAHRLLAVIQSGAEADVRVRVRAQIVEIESKNARLHAIVPIPATEGQPPLAPQTRALFP